MVDALFMSVFVFTLFSLIFMSLISEKTLITERVNPEPKEDGVYSASRDFHPKLKDIQKVNRLFFSFLCYFVKRR